MISHRRPHLLAAFLALALAACGSSAAPGDAAATPAASPVTLATGTSRPSPAAVAPPQPDASAGPLAAPSLTAEPTSGPIVSDLPTRIVIRDIGVDLPIVSGDLTAPGNPPEYPLCDVAQYMTTYRHPGRIATTTWIYAHARQGMFLPLLRGSESDEGRSLIGLAVEIYSDANVRYTYRIEKVLRHATDRGVARNVPTDGRRLVLQTSEGPRGTVPKLQVIAEWVGSAPADAGVAQPTPRPRVCFIP